MYINKYVYLCIRPYVYIYVSFSLSSYVYSLDLVREAISPFPCDYVRNGYCKRVITSTAESKRVFLNHKLHSENED